MKRKFFLITGLALLVVLASACTGMLYGPKTDAQSQIATQNALIVQAAQATATQMALEQQIAALQTQIAKATEAAGHPMPTTPEAPPTQAPPAETAAAPTATGLPPTATNVPPTPTPVPPTATALPPTATRVPATPTATVQVIPCNSASFVADVTIPDGTQIQPGASFTKTWRLKNTGACTWTTNYDLVFSGGDELSDVRVVAFPGNVAPGQVIDLSVKMTAPTQQGGYRSHWKIRDGGGIVFGVGAANTSIYADIRVVVIDSRYPLDFAASYCLAEWTSGAGTLACPSPDNDSRGFVRLVAKPVLESGYQDDEPAVLVHPQMITDGIIRGKYPAYRVQKGDHFVAVIGCAYQMTGCDVSFQLDYQIGNSALRTIKTWHEVYDKEFMTVDVDLKGLVGKDVKFILTVFSNGSSKNDRVQWLAPRIER